MEIGPRPGILRLPSAAPAQVADVARHSGARVGLELVLGPSMTRSLVVGWFVLAGALAGCADDKREARFELTRLGSCDDVRERIRAQVISDMEAQLERSRRAALAVGCFGPSRGA